MPTIEVEIAVSGDDANVGSTAYSTYPGTANATDDTTALQRCEKAFYGAGDGWYRENVYRWNTGAVIPDDATVTSAVARFWAFGKQDNEARSVTLEWYAFDGSVALGDWTSTVGTDAHAGRTIASLTNGQDEDFTLLTPTNVSKTGYTGLRMFISGGAPANINYWDTAAVDHATLAPPRLIVTYTEVATYRFDYSKFPKAMMRSR